MPSHHQTMQAFVPSFSGAPDGERVAEVDDTGTVHLTVVLKPAEAIEPRQYAGGYNLSHAEFAQRHGSRTATIDSVVQFARAHGLEVEAIQPERHRVELVGTYAQARAAFSPDGLGVYEQDGRRFVARTGCLHVPAELAPEIVAILGFDQRPVAEPRFVFLPRQTATSSYDPAAVAQKYQFPIGVDGTGETIALVELGGGFNPDDIAQYFAETNVARTGTLVSVAVDGVDNTPGGDADGEVQLDIEIAGSVAPGANIAVYFGPNSASGFVDLIQAATHDTTNAPSIMSISWGQPESNWAAQDLDAMDQAFQSAAALGISVCVASGDAGAVDNAPNGQLTTDFPASSPNVLGCGGTSLPPNGPETAWNSNGGASGGGYSAHFPLPSWQTGVSGSGRGVPDVAADADPDTGYNVSVDGQDTVAGGTSAAAPLWAGLIALINQQLKRKVGLINPVLYAAPSALNDIVTGNNNGYSAGPGWDPVTGLGSPKGDAVLTALTPSPTTS
jgi:kumamolisin